MNDDIALNGSGLNDLAFWFEKLRATGVPVPRTTIVRAEGSAHLDPLLEELAKAAAAFGYPVFLRTGHGSGKHQWKRTCFVPNEAALRDHVFALLEWSEVVDMLGLPTETWVVRELLPLVTTFRAFDGEMPINKERRYFIEGGRVLCHHPYWPERSIQEPDCDGWGVKLAALNEETDDEVRALTKLSECVSKAFDGAWSLDWAQTTSGQWVAIDMAIAERSFHWDGCPVGERIGPRQPREEPAPDIDYSKLIVPSE
ncbi:MAG: ATP-grasp domain-containing protein [Polyangiales bacterium]